MHLDGDVGREDEQGLQVLGVLVDALGLVAVRPGHHDVLGMALTQPVPFLVGEHVEVQGVEDLEVLLDVGAWASAPGGGVTGFAHGEAARAEVASRAEAANAAGRTS